MYLPPPLSDRGGAYSTIIKIFIRSGASLIYVSLNILGVPIGNAWSYITYGASPLREKSGVWPLNVSPPSRVRRRLLHTYGGAAYVSAPWIAIDPPRFM
jgi:hypothetical protein